MSNPLTLVRVRTADTAIRGGVWLDQQVELLGDASKPVSLFEILESESPPRKVDELRQNSTPVDHESVALLPPVVRQEIWAAGVTYTRS